VLSPTRLARLHIYFPGCTASIIYCSFWSFDEVFINLESCNEFNDCVNEIVCHGLNFITLIVIVKIGEPAVPSD
jgi:hypothetical protein